MMLKKLRETNKAVSYGRSIIRLDEFREMKNNTLMIQGSIK